MKIYESGVNPRLELPSAGYDYSPEMTKFMSSGACRKHDPRFWETNTRDGRTPVRGLTLTIGNEVISRADAIEFARNICSGCPVSLKCKEFIRTYPNDEGIWAGLLPEER